MSAGVDGEPKKLPEHAFVLDLAAGFRGPV